MNSVTVIITCYNSRLIPENGIKNLRSSNDKVKLAYVALDDNCTDDTNKRLLKLRDEGYEIESILGTGKLFGAL